MIRSQFSWKKSGRQFVSRVGNLSMHVKVKGNQKTGLHYRVSEVFGTHFRSGWTEHLGDAILEAEDIAVREARVLTKAVRGKHRTGRKVPESS